MRDASSIDPSHTPPTEESLAADAEARQHNEQEYERLCAEKAEHTDEGRAFLARCIAATERMIDQYASGIVPEQVVIDERAPIARRRRFGTPNRSEPTGVPERAWKYFHAQIVDNGNLDEADQVVYDIPLAYPPVDGYIITFTLKAEWLERVLVEQLERAGYERTTYINCADEGIDGTNCYILHDVLAYALPSR